MSVRLILVTTNCYNSSVDCSNKIPKGPYPSTSSVEWNGDTRVGALASYKCANGNGKIHSLVS